MIRALYLALCIAVFPPLTARGQTCSPVSVGLSVTPGLPADSHTYTMTSFDDGVHGPRFYAGGSIPTLGNVAVLGATGWEAAATPSLTGPIYTLEVLQDDLVTGGNPTLFAGGSGVHRWDADHWTSLGSLGPVYAVMMYNDGPGGQLVLHVVAGTSLFKRVGTTWQELGQLGITDPQRLIQRVLVFDEDGPGPLPSCIYFCSSVNTATTAATGQTVTGQSGLVRWNGESFTPIPATYSGSSPTLTFGRWITSAAIFDDGAGPALFISGHGTTPSSVVRWRSVTQTWDPVPPNMTAPSSGAAYGLAVLHDGSLPLGRRLYAVTQGVDSFNQVFPPAKAIAWNGQSWTAVRNLPSISVSTPQYHHAMAAGVLAAGRVPAVLLHTDISGPLGLIGCRCRGDVNLDGAMTLADRAIITSHLGMTQQSWSDGDLNGNDVVNNSDLAIVCTADFNCDSTVGTTDILEFLSAWFLGEPRADYNGVSGVSTQDIFDFLNGWFIGC